jgi:hypothetical protein
MRASDSRTAGVDVHVPGDAQIGPVGAYVGRPGFWHGGVGVAACWHGIAERIGSGLAVHAGEHEDPHLAAARGRAIAVLAASRALLAAAGRQIDERRLDETAARQRALLVRVAVERSARDVLETSMAAQGATALCFDGRHARAVADLAVYLGQLHRGRDEALVVDQASDDWWAS